MAYSIFSQSAVKLNSYFLSGFVFLFRLYISTYVVCDVYVVQQESSNEQSFSLFFRFAGSTKIRIRQECPKKPTGRLANANQSIDYLISPCICIFSLCMRCKPYHIE